MGSSLDGGRIICLLPRLRCWIWVQATVVSKCTVSGNALLQVDGIFLRSSLSKVLIGLSKFTPVAKVRQKMNDTYPFFSSKSQKRKPRSPALRILDKFGNANGSRTFTNTFVGSKATNMHGWRELILRSDILDESKNYLDSNGTLVFMLSLSMKEPTTARPAVFVPQNPFINLMQQKFLDKETADVCFEFSSAEVKEDRAKRLQSSTSFMPTVSF